MMSRVEQMVKALLNGEEFTLIPRSRAEIYLKAALDGAGTENLPIPRSRLEILLYQLAERGLGGNEEILKLKDFSYFFADGVHQEYVGKIDTSEATNFAGMFKYFSSYGSGSWIATMISRLDTSKGENFAEMFSGCRNITSIPEINTSKGVNLGGIFKQCEQLVTVPTLDTSNNTNFSEMFYNCYKLRNVSSLDTSNGTNFMLMFYGCKVLENVTNLDTSKGENLSQMFASCQALVTAPELDLSSAKNLRYLFNSCTKLTEFHASSTPKLIEYDGMFSSCTNLHTIELDLNRGRGTTPFLRCTNLTNLVLYNIKNDITIGSGTSYGHLLTVDSLVHTFKELCTINPDGYTAFNKTLTIGSENLAKIEGLYCRILDITDEKKPMELCESTDEGAMTLIDYAAEKDWNVQ